VAGAAQQPGSPDGCRGVAAWPDSGCPARRAIHDGPGAPHRADDRAGTYALLDAAERTAPETVRFNGYARDMLLSLAATPPTGLRDEVRALCVRVGVRL